MITFDDSRGAKVPAITIADESSPAVIKVVGIGGGGSNAVTG